MENKKINYLNIYRTLVVMCIDLYYDRKFKKGDEIENFDSFLEGYRSQIEKTDKRKIVIVDKGVLRVGRRGSGNYFRVYRQPNEKDIWFELELTKSVVKNFEFYLFSNQFEKLDILKHTRIVLSQLI